MSAAPVVTIAGGVGAAKFLRGLVVARGELAATDIAIVNVADDFVLHGLSISPDLDTCTYTLADDVNPETGWGRRGESWRVMDELATLGGQTWFRLGDRDLAVHLYRTHRRSEGATLTEITAELTASIGVPTRLLPVTDDPIETRVVVADEGEIGFQDYFVGRQHGVVVEELRFRGADAAVPGPEVLGAIAGAETVVVAPSNPLVSVGPVLAVPGVRDALVARRDKVVAVSPIVGGAALKGPADRMLRELGHEASVVGVARLYADIAGTLVVDDADAELADAVRAAGMECVVTNTIMSDVATTATLATEVLAAARGAT